MVKLIQISNNIGFIGEKILKLVFHLASVSDSCFRLQNYRSDDWPIPESGVGCRCQKVHPENHRKSFRSPAIRSIFMTTVP